MHKSWFKLQRGLMVLALGGTALATNCNTAYFRDYQKLYQTVGENVIQAVSDRNFKFGPDWEWVRVPATTFVRAVWDNWIDIQIPDDVELPR